MKLYHGSNIEIDHVNLAMCRPYKDFGKGFYLTDIKEQAERMAVRVSRIYGGFPVVNVYEIENDFKTLVQGMIYKKTSSQYSFHTERSIQLLRKVVE